MTCLTCGTPNAETARFCSDCGGELRARNPLPPQSAAPAEEITRHSGKAADESTVVDRESDPLPGSTIAGKYRIKSKLGAGGMGTVYRATRLLIGDVVAIKILHSEQKDPKAAERFRREAQASARLKHLNAVTIYDFGVTDDGLQYLVMDLVEGETLRHIIKQQGPLSPSAAAEIVSQVCGALDEAHRLNIIHRDIKPDNIVVNVMASGLRVKVLDFGIAKLRDDAAGNLTQTGSIFGTPHYMSPEQCLGEELDGRSDIYSLAVVLYEMLTGILPFNSPTASAVVVQQVTQPPPPLRALNPSIPPPVERTVLRALEKQRQARPETAATFARELASSMSGQMEKTSPHVSQPHERLFSPVARDTAPTVAMSIPMRSDSFSGPAGTLAQQPAKRGVLGYVAVGLGALLVGVVVVMWAKSGVDRPVNSTNASDPSTPSTSGIGSTLRAGIVCTASSARSSEAGVTYQASNLLDGNLATAWDEGVSGPGIGEWVRCDFGREVKLTRISIAPGYFKSAGLWKQNNRLASATFYASDGSSRRFAFQDLMTEQRFEVDGITATWVRMVVEGIYPGTSDAEDTPISSLSFEGEYSAAERPTRFSVTSCNSIKDTQTLLEWFVGPDRDMTWYQAQQWTVDLDNCDGRWRMPTIEEIRTLYEPTSKAGIGYYTGGQHFPAHINSVFDAIGGGSWVWADERVGDDARALNLNQGKAVTYSAMNTVYSTRAFAVRNFKK